MSESQKTHIMAMIDAAASQNPKEFSANFNHAINQKISDRLDDQRKVIAALVFSGNTGNTPKE